jgi:toxin HigB-1
MTGAYLADDHADRDAHAPNACFPSHHAGILGDAIELCHAVLKLQLAALDNAESEKDMNAPGWRLHPLHGDLEDHWSADVSGNWRLTFALESEDAVLMDYQDYH